MFRLFTRRALAHLVLVLAASACCHKKLAPTPAPAADAATPVVPLKLALDWVPEPEFGGFYAGRESGAYLRHGIKLEIQGGGAGVPVLQMVATGRADFGTVGADELVTARTRGADVVALFATFQTSPQGIMVHAARKLHKVGRNKSRFAQDRSHGQNKLFSGCNFNKAILKFSNTDFGSL